MNRIFRTSRRGKILYFGLSGLLMIPVIGCWALYLKATILYEGFGRVETALSYLSRLAELMPKGETLHERDSHSRDKIVNGNGAVAGLLFIVNYCRRGRQRMEARNCNHCKRVKARSSADMTRSFYHNTVFDMIYDAKKRKTMIKGAELDGYFYQ